MGLLPDIEPASVAQLDALSDWRPGGRGFNRRRGRQHSFVEIDHEIFSTVLRARRNEKEMKVKPATSFKLLTIFIHKKVRQDSKQKNVNKQYLSSLCHKVPLK